MALQGRPDCLILDINMPQLDGYALAERVRRESSLARVKLIAVSAYSHSDHVRRTEEVGFDYRLTKPALPGELERLLAMIENILKLTEKTEELAQKNVAAAQRTEELAQKNVALAGQTKDLLQEVKEGLKEVKQDVQEIKEEIREVKEQVDQNRVEKSVGSEGQRPS
ncbi:Chemotaxis protein methyltransferase CheR [Frigoriglobus tundricola]|uniref:Chemotaxis protein methyltransferase CheR n=2 Tax=Frigoriglobus tundricola TaxID=2774151 RepID=A0A6M5Z0M8_9BACT|nr:Chemotaxis protein methyltransferase CheR [Frigoriglobus tundricola]